MLHPENPKPVDSPFRDFVKAEKGVSKKTRTKLCHSPSHYTVVLRGEYASG